MATLTFPYSQVISSGTYTLDITSPATATASYSSPSVPTPSGTNPPIELDTFLWMGLYGCNPYSFYDTDDDTLTYYNSGLSNSLVGNTTPSTVISAPAGASVYYILLLLQYYTRMVVTIDVNVVRTTSHQSTEYGILGVSVVDAIEITQITFVFSDAVPANFTTYFNEGLLSYINADLAALGYSKNAFPSTLTWSSNTTEANQFGIITTSVLTFTGFVAAIPLTAILFNNGYTINTLSPNCTVDMTNSFTYNSVFVPALYTQTYPLTIHKIIGNELFVSTNGVTTLRDPQTDVELAPGGALQPSDMEQGRACYFVGKFTYQYVDNEYTIGYQLTDYTQDPNGFQVYGGIGGNFNLSLTNPAPLPLGTLTGKSIIQGQIPSPPPLTILPNATQAAFSQVPGITDVTAWGGFRFVTCTAQVTGFSTTTPLPKMYLGILPVSLMGMWAAEKFFCYPYDGVPTDFPRYIPTTQAIINAIVQNNATQFGTFYRLPVQQGTNEITLDLARPIQGSGTWGYSKYNSYSSPSGSDGPEVTTFYPLVQPDPLGIGMFNVNPCGQTPGTTSNYEDYNTRTLIDFDTAVLVLVVDAQNATIAQGQTQASVTLTNFQFIEKFGSTVEIDPVAFIDNPVTNLPTKVSSGMEVSTPLSGSFFTVRRDGKPSLQISLETPHSVTESGRVDIAQLQPGVDFPIVPMNDSGYLGVSNGVQNGPPFNWITFLNAITRIKNGYQWDFEALYSNYPENNDLPMFLVPPPSSFPATPFTAGSVTIPIGYQCVAYFNECPWVPMTVAGDGLNSVDNCQVELLALSDYEPIWAGGSLTAQSAKLVHGVPVPTLDYGPAVLTPDASGFLSQVINTNPVLQQIFNEPQYVQPQIDGVLVSFDRGLAANVGYKANLSKTVFVPIRNGNTNPYCISGTYWQAQGLLGIPSRKTLAALDVRSLNIPQSICNLVTADNTLHVVAHHLDAFGYLAGLSYYANYAGHPRVANGWDINNVIVTRNANDDNPSLGMDNSGRLHLVYDTQSSPGTTTTPRVAVSYETYSDDDGQTWSTPVEMNIPKGMFPRVYVSPEGTIYRAAYVDDGTGQNSGVIQGQIQYPGDTVPSAPFIFQKYNAATSALIPISVQQGAFSIDMERDGSGRWILTCLEADLATPSEYLSADDKGGTWVLLPAASATPPTGVLFDGGNATENGSLIFEGGDA